KNKLFFFGGFQGTRVRQDPNDVRSFVPTAAMLAGDFTAFASAACNAKGAITLKAPFVNNRIDPALFSPVAKNIAARIPKTNDPSGEVTYGQRTIDNEKQIVTKVDYSKSSRHSIFGRGMLMYIDNASPLNPNNVLSGAATELDKAYAYTIGSTYLVSSTT